jgi:hypothetical protein
MRLWFLLRRSLKSDFHLYVLFCLFVILILLADEDKLTAEDQIVLAYECEEHTAAIEEGKNVTDETKVNGITQERSDTASQENIEEIVDEVKERCHE